jgi:hypothetical protein
MGMDVFVEVASVVVALSDSRCYGNGRCKKCQYTGFHSDEDSDETLLVTIRFTTKQGCLTAFWQKIHKNVDGVLKTPTFVETYTA